MNSQFSATWSNSSKLLHCVLQGKWLEAAPGTDVVVENTHIVIKKGYDTCDFVLSGIELHPETCRGLKFTESGELHFSVKGELNGNDGDVYKKDVKTFSVQNDTVDKIEKLQNKWYCAACKQKILNNWSIFSRVLPLPSENWSDFADMWFCHNHGDEKDTVQPQKASLLPKDRDCFVGETYVLVARKHVSAAGVKVTKQGTVLCKRCGIQLGEPVVQKNEISTEEDVIKFFLHTLLIEDLAVMELMGCEMKGPNRVDLNSFFRGLLMEQSTTYASYRFIVESHSTCTGAADSQKKTSTCLIWLLDSNVQMFRSYDTTVQQCGMSQSMVKQIQAIKIMFQCQLDGLSTNRPPDYVTKSVISLWKKDNTVHGFQLPHPIFLQLIHLLVNNCKSLPPSQRYLNGFHLHTDWGSYLNHCAACNAILGLGEKPQRQASERLEEYCTV